MLNQLESYNTSKEEFTTCKCSNQWFEQVTVNRYSATHSTVLGQALPPAGSQSFILLRCVKCSAVYQPNINLIAQDSATKLYNVLLDQLEDYKAPEPDVKVKEAEVAVAKAIDAKPKKRITKTTVTPNEEVVK